ncbi:AraC family transcriptional regulator [uncultured Rhodoblastus sp.]|uniref:AraC family transcriptional regulator n=1 Tax=uncultured Rhodoblastus sp. TaxID=543037 RepID=UPI0025FCB89E|nr:AraC family transcriptional regulator [uncultured Rhodoblastus sp.]
MDILDGDRRDLSIDATETPRVGPPGDLRVSPLLPIPALLAARGADVALAFARAAVEPVLFERPDNRISIAAGGRLLAICAEMTGCRHFGLLLAEGFDLKGLGPIGELMRHCANVGDALEALVRHFHLHDRGAAPVLLSPDRSSVLFGYSVFRHDLEGVDQIHATAIAIGCKILRELCGPAFSPIRVQFAFARPRSIAPYGRLFSANLAFDADISAIVFDSSWLSRPLEGADPAARQRCQRAILEAEAHGPICFGERVESALHQLVLSGDASSEAVAALFDVHERTLRRLLRDEGKSLRELVSRTRGELARQLLSNTALPVSEIAASLHYDDANAFSRAFRNWTGHSPTQWRARDNSNGIIDLSGLSSPTTGESSSSEPER